MGRTLLPSPPSLQRRIKALGDNLRLARLRRSLTAAQVAECAGVSLPTLSSVEHGDPAVSFGVYANVLFVLGLDSDLDAVAKDDELGRQLQDLKVTTPKRVRKPKKADG